MQKIKFLSDMRARIQTIPARGGGGGGGGERRVELLLEGGSYQYKWQLMIFMGRSGPPAHIRVSNSLNSHFIFYFLLGLVNSQNVCLL